MITLRLDPQLEQAVHRAADHLGMSKSELIRTSILEYLSRRATPNAWEIGQDLFGKYASGCGELSSIRKELVKEKLAAKRQ